MRLAHVHVKSWTFLFENVNNDFTTRDTTNWYEASNASLKILTISDKIYMYIVYYIERIYNISTFDVIYLSAVKRLIFGKKTCVKKRFL